MFVDLKNCDLCIHKNICSIKEEYSKITQECNSICNDHNIKSFSINLDCHEYKWGPTDKGYRKVD